MQVAKNLPGWKGRKLLSFLVILLLPLLQGYFNNWQNLLAKKTGPQITFDTTQKSFGKAYLREDHVVVKFPFTNTGNAPVEIQQIQADSSRIEITKPPEEPVMPGKSDTVILACHGNNRGSYKATVTVVTNELAQEKHVLEVNGKMLAPAISFKREVFDFGKVNLSKGKDTILKAYFPFTNTGNAPLWIKQLKYTCNCLFNFPKRPIRPGNMDTIQGVLTERPDGRFHHTLSVHVNMPFRGRDKLTLKGKVVRPTSKE